MAQGLQTQPPPNRFGYVPTRRHQHPAMALHCPQQRPYGTWILDVVQYQQPTIVRLQPAHRPVEALGPRHGRKPVRQRRNTVGQQVLRLSADPPHHPMVNQMSVRILKRQLCLAYPAQPVQRLTDYPPVSASAASTVANSSTRPTNRSVATRADCGQASRAQPRLRRAPPGSAGCWSRIHRHTRVAPRPIPDGRYRRLHDPGISPLGGIRNVNHASTDATTHKFPAHVGHHRSHEAGTGWPGPTTR